MKKIRLILILLLVIPNVVFAQDAPAYLWPIEGAKSGSDIVSAPQGYIDKELNFAHLFITAPEGTPVVAPCEGTITSISISYLTSLTYMTSYGYDTKDSFDTALPGVREEAGVSVDPRYLSGSLSIRTTDGSMFHISGLQGDRTFKTGQKIGRGDPIGTVGYSYHKFAEPTISITISRNSVSADPMAPFGIKSSFIAPKEIKPIVSLTREEAKEDFTIYIDALKEAYPGLYYVISEEELEQFTARTLREIEEYGENIDFTDFQYIMGNTVARIHDSHIYMHPPIWEKGNGMPDFQPKIWFGFLRDTLVCINAVKEYEHLLYKEIVSVNGLPPDSIRKIIHDRVNTYDAQVESYKDYRAALLGFGAIFRGNERFDMTVELADGQTVDIPGHNTKNGYPRNLNDFRPFMMANYHGNEKTAFKHLNDSTAYLGISTFQLNQVEVENIGSFLSDSMGGKEHLIIDLRNNGGGDVLVLHKLYSFIALDTLRLNGYSRVNKKGNFNAFQYSNNYQGVDIELFPDFTAEEGRPGFYLRNESENTFVPDSSVHYTGKVYVLTNENSISAATVFPALVVRARRGVVVGRETRTAYHFMNALKFMDFRLPNSQITLTIPLVEIHFDTAQNERVPFGRGVLPDYPVPLSLDELRFTDGDAILNRALRLIENGEYLRGEDPFLQTAEEKPAASRTWLYYVLGAVGISIVAILASYGRRKRKTS